VSWFDIWRALLRVFGKTAVIPQKMTFACTGEEGYSSVQPMC
jgi:hypothetical protein